MEQLLPFETFSHRLGLNIERLPELLDELKPREAQMRRALRRVQPAFSWSASEGLAYDYVLRALCHRAMELRGRLQATGGTCTGPPSRLPEWFPPALVEAVGNLRAERRAAVARWESSESRDEHRGVSEPDIIRRQGVL